MPTDTQTRIELASRPDHQGPECEEFCQRDHLLCVQGILFGAAVGLVMWLAILAVAAALSG
ncbi:MAG TPA: hypothetical protein VIL32_04265 [Steroidobacteraceae bacterium]